MNTKFKKIAVFLVVVMTTLSLSINTFAWGGDWHEYLATDAVSSAGISLNSSQTAILEFGSRFPDGVKYSNGNVFFSPTYSYGKGPLHGGIWSTWNNGVECNYMGCYIYLTRVAQLLGNGTTVVAGTVPQSYGMFLNDYNALKGYITSTGVGGKSWSDIFTFIRDNYNVSVSDTPANRKLFAIGIAIHTATDLFAHSSWEETSYGYWERILHPYADDVGKITSRYDAAYYVASNILATYSRGAIGSVKDFVVPAGFLNADFFIGNYCYYAKRTDANTYTANINGFRNLDLSYQCYINGWSYDFTDDYGNEMIRHLIQN